MNKESHKEIKKRFTLGEELFNSISHGAGACLSIAGTVVLIVMSALYSDAWAVVSASIYGSSLIILYTMSTLYHAITNNTAKKFFRIMDHNTIFFLIAGTYTPFTLVTLRGSVGWTVFGIIWGFAALGIVLNSVNLEKFSKISLVCYIVMGWAIVFTAKPLLNSAPKMSLVFLIIGGLFYTIGVIFYVLKKYKWMHSIWHLFVVGGSIFHYFSILIALVQG